MAAVQLNEDTLGYYKERLVYLKPDTKPQWGQLDAEHMLRHLTYTVELSLGEVDASEIRDIVPSFLQPLVYLFAFKLFTNWPKGKLKAPAAFLPPPQAEFSREREILIEALERFARELDRNPNRKTHSPVVGDIPLKKWSRVHGVHFDHHFRQFGLA